MNGPRDDDIKPSINDRLDRLDKRIGEHKPCPICGNTEWTRLPDRLALIVLDARGKMGQGSVHAAALRCDDCFFLRLHSLAPSEG